MISLEGKTWMLNVFPLFCKKIPLFNLIIFLSCLMGVKNPYVDPITSSITSGLDHSVLSKTIRFPYRFFSDDSDIIRC